MKVPANQSASGARMPMAAGLVKTGAFSTSPRLLSAARVGASVGQLPPTTIAGAAELATRSAMLFGDGGRADARRSRARARSLQRRPVVGTVEGLCGGDVLAQLEQHRSHRGRQRRVQRAGEHLVDARAGRRRPLREGVDQAVGVQPLADDDGSAVGMVLAGHDQQRHAVEPGMREAVDGVGDARRERDEGDAGAAVAWASVAAMSTAALSSRAGT